MSIAAKISELIDIKSAKYKQLSNQIWDYAETRFAEFQSAKALSNALEQEGFNVEYGVSGLQTGFIGSYGSGGPVIAILGEFDALAGLSQKADSFVFDPVVPNGNGHGCGHHLLGVGSLAAAIAIKDYLHEHQLKATVKYYGCPAEESGYGKSFMARDRHFDDVDLALSWHPHTFNTVMNVTSNAVIHATFSFKGRSAHAGAAPHLGRSALDAVELMNVSTNYLREHMVDEARIHYAVTNTGGLAPNVVQSEAEVTYLIRAPKPNQVKSLFERVTNCAKGASLMTETTVEIKMEGSCHNLIPNKTLEKVMHQAMQELSLPEASFEEIEFAKAIYHSFTEEERQAAEGYVGKDIAKRLAEKPIAEFVAPYSEKIEFMGGSTDVADCSWNVPTVQCLTSTFAFGTPFHTWQVVAQGKQPYAKNAMLLAGKAMASTAVTAIQSETIIEKATEEWQERLDGEVYEALIPNDLKPPVFVRESEQVKNS